MKLSEKFKLFALEYWVVNLIGKYWFDSLLHLPLLAHYENQIHHEG